MRKSKIAALVAATALLVVGSAIAAMAATTGWVEESGAWKYYKNGEAQTETFAKSGDISFTHQYAPWLITMGSSLVLNDSNRRRVLAFTEYLKSNEFSENSIRSYVYAVSQFFDSYDEMNKENLNSHWSALRTLNSCSTVNQRINAVNHFIRFEDSTLTPSKLSRITRNCYADNVISREEFELLKSNLRRDEDVRLYYLVRILGSTGMRISEALDVRAGDIRRGFVDVHSKGNKYRRVYFPVSLANDKLNQMAYAMEESDHIFMNKKGDPLSPAGARFLLRERAKQYGIPVEHVHPHAFRHMFALNFMEKQKDISMLSDLLGHESIETTRIYLRKGIDEQREIVNRVINW